METKYEIVICLGGSCFSRGNKDVLAIVKDYLKEYNLNAEVFFHGDLCRGKCEEGPILSINNTLFSNVSIENVYELLNGYFGVK